MKYTANYKCNTCESTAVLIFDTEKFGRFPYSGEFPNELVCGWRDCRGTKIRFIEPINRNNP